RYPHSLYQPPFPTRRSSDLRTNAQIPGEAYANLFTVPASTVQKVAHTLNMSNGDITLPAGKETTLEKIFTVDRTTTIFMLTSHIDRKSTRLNSSHGSISYAV